MITIGKLLPQAITLARYASRGVMLGIMSAAGTELETQFAGLLKRRHVESPAMQDICNFRCDFSIPACPLLTNISRGLERTSDLNATLAQNESLKQELRLFILPKIRELLAENPIVLFMKGTPDSPECGFSKFASMLLKYNNIDFVSVDVLDDPRSAAGHQALRQLADHSTTLRKRRAGWGV